MKKLISVFAVIVLTVSMLAMVSCGTSEFSGEVANEQGLTITAKNAAAGDYFMTGSLVFEEGEQLSIEASLESGDLTIEFISADGADDAEELPDTEAEALYTAFVSGDDAQTVSMESGTYMVKVTATEKATGTVSINVVGAN